MNYGKPLILRPRKYKIVTPKKLSWWFKKINKSYFEGKLPSPALLRFAKHPYKEEPNSASGYSWQVGNGTPKILIEETLALFPRVCASTLMHEMIHFYGYINNWTYEDQDCDDNPNSKFAKEFIYITSREPYLRG